MLYTLTSRPMSKGGQNETVQFMYQQFNIWRKKEKERERERGGRDGGWREKKEKTLTT